MEDSWKARDVEDCDGWVTVGWFGTVGDLDGCLGKVIVFGYLLFWIVGHS